MTSYREYWTPTVWVVAGLKPWEMDDLSARELKAVLAAVDAHEAGYEFRVV